MSLRPVSTPAPRPTEARRWRFALALAALVPATGCSGSDDGPTRPFALVDLPVPPRLERGTVPPLPPESSVLYLEAGVAQLAVTLAPLERSPAGELVVARYELPLLPAPDPTPALAQPSFRGGAIDELEQGGTLESADAAAYTLAGRSLRVAVAVAEAARLDALELVYPVYAAELWGAGFEVGGVALESRPEQVLRASWADDEASHEALAIPLGGRLLQALPPGTRGELRAEARLFGGRGQDAQLVVRTGELATELEVPADGTPVPVVVHVEPGLSLEFSADGVGAAGAVAASGLLLLTAPLVVPELEADAAAAPPAPDVLWIVLDTLRADRLGSHGSDKALSPHLDALAARSLRFDQCWSTTSWTLPSMATLLTGNHGGQHRAWLKTKRLGDGLTTLPEVFRTAGYRTAAFTGGGFAKRNFGLQRGFMVFDDSTRDISDAVGRTEAWMRRDRDVPAFALLHTYQVHAPYVAPTEGYDQLYERYGEALLGRDPDPSLFKDVAAEHDGRMPAAIVEAMEAFYDEEVRYTDHVLGELFERLEVQGRLRDMLVVITADHGEEFGEHGLLGHSDSLYVEQLHVPFLVKLPGDARAGEVDQRLVSQLDFAPTVVDAAGLAARLPGVVGTTFDGVSLLSSAPPSPVYATRFNERAGLLHGLRSGSDVYLAGAYRWQRAERAGRELYDLVDDPTQQRNRAGVDERAAELDARLNELEGRFGQARVSESDAALDTGSRSELRNLGYAGDDDE